MCRKPSNQPLAQRDELVLHSEPYHLGQQRGVPGGSEFCLRLSGIERQFPVDLKHCGTHFRRGLQPQLLLQLPA
ncbi:hypothetical protein ACFSQ7_09375 [Paenibacillus rhizoplanae]